MTGRDLAPTLRFAERLASIGKPVWVRFTLVPGLTDDPANVEGIASFVAPMKNVEWVEVQPFHQMGEFKWKAMGLDYKHDDTPAPSRESGEPGHRPISRCGLPRTLIALASTVESRQCWTLRATSSAASRSLTAFLAIGVGYLVGQINIGGFSLGVGAVLFVGLAIGAFAPKAQIIGPIGLTGLIMFLYGIGILYGRQFFEGMVGAAGQSTICWRWSPCLAGLAGRARAGADLRHQDRPYARPLRRLDDQHRHAAGRARRHARTRIRRSAIRSPIRSASSARSCASIS